MLCSFKHSKVHTKEDNDDELEVEEVENTDHESVECDYCEKKFEDIDDLIDHFGKTGHNLPEDQHAAARP